MHNGLSTQTLAALGARFAVLSVGRYALPVRFRIRPTAVECRVPTWSGVADLLAELGEVTLAAAAETGPDLRWVFLRGPAAVVADPDWAGLEPPHAHRVGLDDLYQLLRIEPRRIELVDEARGWGVRETVDL